MSRLILIYCVILVTVLSCLMYVSKTVYEWTYYDATCGEALFRHDGMATVEDEADFERYMDCVIYGRKRWNK